MTTLRRRKRDQGSIYYDDDEFIENVRPHRRTTVSVRTVDNAGQADHASVFVVNRPPEKKQPEPDNSGQRGGRATLTMEVGAQNMITILPFNICGLPLLLALSWLSGKSSAL